MLVIETLSWQAETRDSGCAGGLPAGLAFMASTAFLPPSSSIHPPFTDGTNIYLLVQHCPTTSSICRRWKEPMRAVFAEISLLSHSLPCAPPSLRSLWVFLQLPQVLFLGLLCQGCPSSLPQLGREQELHSCIYPFARQSSDTDSMLTLLGTGVAAANSCAGCALHKFRVHQSYHRLVHLRAVNLPFWQRSPSSSLWGMHGLLVRRQQWQVSRPPLSPSGLAS